MSSPRRGKSRPDEVAWKDADRCHGRVIGYDELRLEQPQCPEDAVALIEAGEPADVMNVVRASAAYLTPEQAVDAALVLLDAAARGRAETDEWGPPKGPVNDDDHERRWRLHVHACSINDMTFWVEKTENGWKATEVETGVTAAEAPSERAAMENYWEHRY